MILFFLAIKKYTEIEWKSKCPLKKHVHFLFFFSLLPPPMGLKVITVVILMIALVLNNLQRLTRHWSNKPKQIFFFSSFLLTAFSQYTIVIIYLSISLSHSLSLSLSLSLSPESSNFYHPFLHPHNNMFMTSMFYCIFLGWSLKSREKLNSPRFYLFDFS